MAELLHVRLLGGFEVAAAGRSVAHGAWRLRRAKTLVKLLALEPGHRLHRDRVEEQLWPGRGPEATHNNFHQVVHAARKALSTVGVDGTAALALQDDLVVLGAGGEVVTDLEELEAAVRAAQARRDHLALTAALERWSGELLPEDSYEAWTQNHRSSYRQWRSQLVLELVDAWLADGDAEAAVSLLAPVVGADPLHEPAHRAMMRALAAAGRRSEALLLFEQLRAVLDQELAAEPEPETRQLYRDLLSDDGGVTAPGNLPAPVVTLVGRSRELAEVDGLLERTRLLTLTGPGGAGKTTLAVELARRRAERYPGGVYLVELGALADSELVVPELAQSIGLQLPSQAHAADAVVAQLKTRQTLIVVDNCEHLLDACARIIAALLRGCPGVTVLATSREPLRIEGEVAWRTPSLSLPDPAGPRSVAELSAVASVDLFVRRAAAAAPGFTLTPENAAAVAEICHRLDGMPLALELAAACAPALSPQQIADRLGDSLGLLRRGDRAAITRQQTLEATLAWSHDLLGAEEKQLFRRLAVFAGSFTLEAVESVCGEGLAPARVLDAVARLIDTSLVVADARAGVARYRLLETVRQYAMERLRAAGEQADVQQRHCDWYLRFAQAHDPERSGTGNVSPASLDVEHDNLRAALTWSLHQRPSVALELAVALWRYWLARGFFAEGSRWLEAVLSAVPEPSVLRVRALLGLAVFDIRRGSDHRLGEIGAEALDVHRAHGDRARLAQALSTDAALAYMRGRWAECWQRCLEARELADDCGAEQVAAAARHLQAMVLLGRGELPAAAAAFDEVSAVLPGLSETTGRFFLPLMLGYAVEGVGTPDGLRLYFEETILLGRRVGAPEAAAYLRCNLAYLARLAGDPEQALELLREARSRFAALGDRDGEALALNHLGCVHRTLKEYDEGRDAFARSLQLRRALGDRRAIGLTLSNLGVLTAREKGVDGGLALLDEALAGFRETGDVPGRVASSLTAASVHLESGDCEIARRLLQETLSESDRIPGNHRATAWGFAMLSDVHRRLGQIEEAARVLRQAGDRFAAIGAVDGSAYVKAHERPAQTRR